MPNGITKQTFLNSDTNTQLSILYDMQAETNNLLKDLKENDTGIKTHCRTQWNTCDDRFKKLEKHWYKVVGVLIFLAAISPFISTVIIKYWI